MKKILLFICLAAIAIQARAQTLEEVSIIPQPVKVQRAAGEFSFSEKTKIRIEPGNPELKLLGNMLAEHIVFVTGLRIPIVEKKRDLNNAINLTIEKVNDTIGDEGYVLNIRPNRVTIKAGDDKGIFYGLQTLYQLLPAKQEAAAGNKIVVPAIDVVDEPRLSWRGMMLDVGRYFYPVSYIKKFLDYMAMHKLNTFHWHLTEDHGWRLESEEYPELNQISSWRKGTQLTPGGRIDENLHGGYYTKEQVKDIIKYAAQRYITVVPEIEMPGHSLAALAAFPELSCTGGPFEMPVKWGIRKDIFCAGNDQTFVFLENVLSEVAELFPSPIIHIGGDEAPKARWEACSKCQQRIKEEGLENEHELQSYFIKRIEDFLLTKNKTIIGWDEIMEGGLAPNATVMSWRGTEGGIAAAKQHHNVVMSPTSHMYFDFYQGDPTLEPIAITYGPVLDLQKVYSFEPVPAELSSEEAKYILGVQANVWAEFIHSPDKVEYMSFPRAAALSEVAWSQPEQKDWNNFKRKMESQYQRYADMGINYANSAYNVQQKIKVDPSVGKATVSFETDSHDPQIYYSLDGSEPTLQSFRYLEPFEVEEPVLIKAATFKDGNRVSDVSTRSLNQASFNGVLE